MREIAINNIFLMLTVYSAALVFAMQHVGDRYTPKLIPEFLKRTALLPLLLLLVFLSAAGVLVLRPFSHFILHLILQILSPWWRLQPPSWTGDTIAVGLLVSAVLVVLFAGYWLARQLTDGEQLISWLQERTDHQAALQEILLNTIQRSDQRVTAAALRLALTDQLTEQEKFLTWLTDHNDLLKTDWFTQELLNRLLGHQLDETAVRTYQSFFCLLLTKALDEETFLRVRWIIKSLLDALASSPSWTPAHADLLYAIGFVLWKVGDNKNASAPRTVRIPNQLEQEQEFFVLKVDAVWKHVQTFHDPSIVQLFSRSLGEIVGETRGERSILLCIYSVMQNGFSSDLLTFQTIHELASSLQLVRRSYEGDSPVDSEVDALQMGLAAILVERGASDAIVGTVSQYLIGRSHHLLNIPRYGWLKRENYMTLEKMLGLPNVR